MEYKYKNPYIFILSGKAKSGKDQVADIITNYYHNKKVIKISYSYYLKDYLKRMDLWDGREDEKPRHLLQTIGIDLIKDKIDKNFLIKRVCEDIKFFSYFYDIIIVTDARMIDEIEIPKSLFERITTIRIEKNNHDNGLSLKEKEHITEIGLDNYRNFDYIIQNSDNKTIDKIKEILKELEV